MDKLSAVLSAVNTGLTTIRGIAALPGVSMLPYVNTIAGAIDLMQAIAKVGGDVVPFALKVKETFEKPGVSPEDMAELDAVIEAERVKLHAPLPPKEDGEDD